MSIWLFISGGALLAGNIVVEWDSLSDRESTVRAEEVERRFLFEDLPEDVDAGVEIEQTYLDARQIRITENDIMYTTILLLESMASEDAAEISSLLRTEAPIAFRIRSIDSTLILGIKTRERPGVRTEWEWAIPDSLEIRALLGSDLPRVVKKRYRVPAGNDRTWELDVFSGGNEGLMIAEIELGDIEDEFDIPEWLGDEITADDRYLNVSLAATPYRGWTKK